MNKPVPIPLVAAVLRQTERHAHFLMLIDISPANRAGLLTALYPLS